MTPPRATAAVVALLASCDGGREYVAFQEDFADYREWPSFDASGGALDPLVDQATRTVYISEWPKSGLDAFAKGTRIVKVVETDPDPTLWLMVAMAKRGGDYNAAGSPGWEWFDLDLSTSGTPLIDWRGVEPPFGSGYECDLGGSDTGDTAAAVGDCNSCHFEAWDNDRVMSPQLDLDLF